MNAQELALSHWVEQTTIYEKKILTVIQQLSQPLPLIPSPQYDAKFDELKEYLRFNYTYDQEDKFIEIYVHHIAGQKNITLMELSSQLMSIIGGNIVFWQNKIIQIAAYVSYHPQLSIWEINRVFENYLGLSSQLTSSLARKKALGKHYLSLLMAICKNIQKAKGNHQDLLKIDESYKKLKRIQQKYYSFLQQTQNKKYSENSNVSKRAKNTIKESLFLFLKPKKQTPTQTNTLINYNFKIKAHEIHRQTLLQGKQYQQFDEIFKTLRKQSMSRRYSRQKSKKDHSFTESTKIQIQQLKRQFLSSAKRELNSNQSNAAFIWSKQYFFSYWGYIINYSQPIDFTLPYQRYQKINYQIDSQQQFDELNAQDILEQANSSYTSLDNDSFVVSDNHDSSQDEEEQKPDLLGFLSSNSMKTWVKYGIDMKQYEIYPIQSQPLPLSLEEIPISMSYIDKLNYKGRNQIFEFFQRETSQISKIKIELFLKNNFKKIRTKDKRVVYVRLGGEQSDPNKEAKTFFYDSSEAQTLNQSYEVSISSPSKIIQPNQQDQCDISEKDEDHSNTKSVV